MSAAILREAAALMRSRAEAATPGPWEAAQGASGGVWVEAPNTATIADIDIDYSGHPEADGNHIASWHPAVALAVADWLNACALVKEVRAGSAQALALRVARAYLGSAS
jgi:hypothetical protein